MTLANVVTVVRLFLIPLVLLQLAWDNRLAAFVAFLVVLGGDLLDGYLARSRNEITNLGKFLDPLADKLLMLSLMAWFAWAGELSGWAFFLLLAQNIALLAGSFLLFQQERPAISARLSGKGAAAILAVGMVLLFLESPWAGRLIFVGIGASYWVLFDYWRMVIRQPH